MAELIKILREKTGAGFLDCKKALEATNNDIDKAIVWLQEHGIAKAIKKEGNIAAEGAINAVCEGDKGLIFELNCQTDFVAMNEDFKKLVKKIEKLLMHNHFNTLEEALNIKDENGLTINEICLNATAKIGEKISLRRVMKIDGHQDKLNFGAYTHFDGKKGALFVAKGGNSDNLKGIAMHITAMDPKYLDVEQVPAEEINKLKQEFNNSPKLQGKPEQIKQKIADGMLEKALSENTLTKQEYVVEGGKTVEQYLKEINAKEVAMYRFEVGEGIQKQEVDFAAEVASQMKK